MPSSRMLLASLLGLRSYWTRCCVPSDAQDVHQHDDVVFEWVRSLQHAKFDDILQHPLVQRSLVSALSHVGNLASLSDADLNSLIDASLAQLAVTDHAAPPSRCLLVGIALLSAFVQANWTGPPLPTSPLAPSTNATSAPATSAPHSWLSALDERATRLLCVDGEDLYESILHPHLLYLASRLLVAPALVVANAAAAPAASTDASSALHLASAWWAFRCVRVHHELLEHDSATLLAQSQSLLAHVTTTLHAFLAAAPAAPADTLDAAARLQLHAKWKIECIHFHHKFWQYTTEKACLDEVAQLLDLDAEFTGVLGMRTRFQQEEKAQLVLQTRSWRQHKGTSAGGGAAAAAATTPAIIDLHALEAASNGDSDNAYNDDYMPKATSLNSEVLLDDFALQSPETSKPLSSLDRTYLLSLFQYMKHTLPVEHSTTTMELLAILRTLLKVDGWALEAFALYHQSLLELKDHHKQAHGIGQLEDLALHVHPPESLTTSSTSTNAQAQAAVRLDDIYLTAFPNVWDLKRSIGDAFVNLGLRKSALDMFESVHYWDGIIEMCIQLGRKTRAEELIRTRLATNETPKMYTLLADTLEDPSFYEKAWSLSNNTYPRAQRSLGHYKRKRDQHAEAIEHYRLALAINPVFPAEWFAMGFCAMEIKDYETSTMAFSRCVTYDPEYADAWNNLAAAHLHVKNYRSAFQALEQGVKLKFESWKLWENYLNTAMQLGEWQKAMSAVENVLRYKVKDQQVKSLPIDEPIILMLTRVVEDEAAVDKTSFLVQRFLTCLTTLSAQVTHSAALWLALARVHAALGEVDKSVMYREKQVRCLQQGTAWLEQAEVFGEAAEATEGLVRCYLANASTTASYLQSAKFTVQTVLSKAQKSPVDAVKEHEAVARLQQLQAAVQAALSAGSSSNKSAAPSLSSSSSAVTSSYLSMFK